MHEAEPEKGHGLDKVVNTYEGQQQEMHKMKQIRNVTKTKKFHGMMSTRKRNTHGHSGVRVVLLRKGY